MTSALLTRRRALTATLASSLWLAACGGSDDDGGGNANLRALNLTSDLPSLDVFTGDTRQFSALAADALSGNASLGASTYTVSVKSAGDPVALATGSYSLSKDQSYTAVIWGRQSGLRVSTLPESEDTGAISTGLSRVRFFSATVDSGTVDVYFTNTAGELSDFLPSQSGLTAGALGGFRELAAGTWRVRVTGQGDPTDVRLDIPAVTLGDKQYATLILTPSGTGGVLLNGTLLVQQGAKTTVKNTKARVRLAAGVSNGGLVSATYAGSALFTNYRSPRVQGTGAYVQVEAGTAVLSLSVNGRDFSSASRTFAAGSDYTLLAYGTDTAPLLTVLTDDNRVPTTAARAKLRLINALPGSEVLSVLVDGREFTQTSNIAPGSASTYATPTTTGTARLEVTSSLSADPIFVLTVATNSVSLLQQATVYSVFLLGGQAAPFGRLVTDR